MVVGIGQDVVVEQIDPSTLAVRASRSLPVPGYSTNSEGLSPSLTATVDGPLWVAGVDDLWALNPSTGAVDGEIDTGNSIGSMSTNPNGTLLYTSSDVGEGMGVTEYDARSGEELFRSYRPQYLRLAVGSGSVAATNSGVWISVRYGMAGPAFELSADGLNMIAPPSSEGVGHPGIYYQIMGVASSVSEGVLWLTSNDQSPTLTCADPTSGAVRTSEVTSNAVFSPVASGSLLYAITGLGKVVVIDPPTQCFD